MPTLSTEVNLMHTYLAGCSKDTVYLIVSMTEFISARYFFKLRKLIRKAVLLGGDSYFLKTLSVRKFDFNAAIVIA